MNYMHLVQGTELQQAVVNTAMHLFIYKMRDISCLTEKVLASQEEIRSSELVTCHFYVSYSVLIFLSALYQSVATLGYVSILEWK